MSVKEMAEKYQAQAAVDWGGTEFAPDYRDAFLSGYQAGLERAAEISTDHAMTMGPSHDYGMGGHKIASKIRSEARGDGREGVS